MGLGTRALIDTNILIDYLHGNALAHLELFRYESLAISIVTWMEVLVGAPAQEYDSTRAFLAKFTVLPITPQIADRAVTVRRELKIKLADAIILASALVEERLLISRNTRDFPAEEGRVRVPYRV